MSVEEDLTLSPWRKCLKYRRFPCVQPQRPSAVSEDGNRFTESPPLLAPWGHHCRRRFARAQSHEGSAIAHLRLIFTTCAGC